MEVRSKPRMSREEVQKIIDNRLAIILEKEMKDKTSSQKEVIDESNNKTE